MSTFGRRDAASEPWAGGSFDPAAFDLTLVNVLLRSEFAL
jgi:hypothetical protein